MRFACSVAECRDRHAQNLPAAHAAPILGEIEQVLGIPRDEIIPMSAKTGVGVPELLDAVIERAGIVEPLAAIVCEAFEAAMAEARAQEREARRNRPPARPGDELPQSWWDQALRSAGIDLAKLEAEEQEAEELVAQAHEWANPLPDVDVSWLGGSGYSESKRDA